VAVVAVPLIAIITREIAMAADAGLPEHMARLSSDSRLGAAIARTVYLALIAISLEVLLAIAMAGFWSRALTFPAAIAFAAPVLTSTLAIALGLQLAAQVGSLLLDGEGAARLVAMVPGDPALTLVAIEIWQWTPLLMLVLIAQKAAIDPVHVGGLRLMGVGRMSLWITLLWVPWGTTLALFSTFRVLDWFRTSDAAQVLYGSGGRNLDAELLASYLAKNTYWTGSTAYAAFLAILWALLIVLLVRFGLLRILQPFLLAPRDRLRAGADL
jgi:multiple sugar transport system permease protein